jgi:hypothetical protein
VNVVTGSNPFGSALAALAGTLSAQRPDLVPGVPLWLSNPNVAGGMQINPAAFAKPATVQGSLGRNSLRGFDTSEVDLTLRRQFRLYERLALQARADFFNIFNHPNFGAANQLPHFAAVRAGDADAGIVVGRGRGERRTQSAVSDRRATVGTTGFEGSLLIRGTGACGDMLSP